MRIYNMYNNVKRKSQCTYRRNNFSTIINEDFDWKKKQKMDLKIKINRRWSSFKNWRSWRLKKKDLIVLLG